MSGEDELIAWLRERAEARGWHRIGNDAAELPAAPYVVTVDTQIADVHFTPDLGPGQIARRLLAVNLSDLAAMGADPVYAFLALSAPRDFAHREFFDGFINACAEYGVELAGGDLSSQPRITAALTLLGLPGPHSLRRDSARPGHRLYLGGPVGLSALGCRLVAAGCRSVHGKLTIPTDLEIPAEERSAAERAVHRHLDPEPQLALGRWLAGHGAGAALDVSDGLSRDLHRLCRASRVGAMLDATGFQTADDVKSLAARLGSTWQQLALSGGEDYVLLFTLPPDVTPPDSFGTLPIGEVTEDLAVRLRQVNGTTVDLPASGWDHLGGE